MVKEPTILLNKYRRRLLDSCCFFLVAFASCNNTGESSALKLIQTVRIEETGNTVLHDLPLSVQLLGDSLAGIRLDASRYTIYNYYTGKIVTRPALDTGILPGLLRQARANDARAYRLLTPEDGMGLGVSVLSVESVFYRRQEQQYYLFFTASFIVDTVVAVKGITEAAQASHRLYYVATLNKDFRTTGKHTLLKSAHIAPAFLFGGLMLADKLLLPNVELAHIDTPGYGMLCGIGLDREYGMVRSIPVPFDRRSMAQRKNHILEKVSLADIDGQAYYVSDGKRIIYCKDSAFKDFYTMADQEHVYSLYYNGTRKQLYISTCFGDESDLKGSKVFALSVPGKNLNLIDSVSQLRFLDFINDSLILSVSKNRSGQFYEFSLYAY